MHGPRIPKDLQRQVGELEDHLHFLRLDLARLSGDAAYIKRVATELRVLICKASGTDGLLWRLVNALRVDDGVLVHVPGNIDPDHPLARGLSICSAPIQRPTPELERHRRSEIHSLRQLIQEAEAIWVLGMKSYTYERLIRAIAEQAGSAHEDPGIEPGLSAAESLLINGAGVYVPAIAMAALLTLEVGERVIAGAVAAGRYRRRRFAEPLSMTFHLRLLATPAAYEAVGRFRSYIQNTEILGSLGPTSFRWQVVWGGHAREIYCPVADGMTPGTELGFSLAYDDQSSQVYGVSAAGMEQLEGWHLGELRTDLAFEIGPRNPYFRRRAVYLHDRVLEPRDLERLDTFILDREIEL